MFKLRCKWTHHSVPMLNIYFYITVVSIHLLEYSGTVMHHFLVINALTVW